MKLHNGNDINVVDQIQIHNKNYFLVDLGTSMYLNGVMTRYLVCPMQQFDRSGMIPDVVEVVKGEDSGPEKPVQV